MDIKHHYIEAGFGAPLILIHGNGEDCGYFKNQINVFAENRRVIAPDTRGHGKTPRGKAPFTIRQFADDLAGFMDELSIESADILGFSDGANIAMCFAFAYPERVNRLILNAGNLDASGIKPHIQIPVEIGYKAASLFAASSENIRKRAELLGLMVKQPNITFGELARIKADTLVIAGTRDMVRHAHTLLIAKHIKNSQLSIIEGTHFIARDNPIAFNAAIREFLEIQTI